MCGLVGFLGGIVTHGVEGEKALLQRMAGTLVHRGPDDGGVWCDSEQRIGLGHRRLAIVDLSSAGHQPMVSASGRYVIAFNGEIYNHFELMRRLKSLKQDAVQP
jgi:asparagine synthase (glutamine-hydrolysing)